MRQRNLPISAAALATLTLTLAMPASADVIYSNLLNTPIPLNFDGVTINVDGSGTLNPFFGGVGVANNAALQPLRVNTDGLDTIRNLTFGSTIDTSSTFLSSGPGGSQDHLGTTFTAGEEGYIGFKLNGTDYGWMRVIFTNNTGGAMVKDWAYDNSGSAINVGGIQQVGQNIVLSSSFTVASDLQNGGGTTNLIQSGNVTNTLTGTNTYTGATTISAGTLAIGGSGSINNSDVTLSGGTFRYNSSVAYARSMDFTSGTIGGTNLTGSLGGLEIGTGQTLSPGSDIGSGTATTTSQTWSGGGTYQFEISDASATGTAGGASGWDLLTGNGSLSISATSGSSFNIDIDALGLNASDVNFDGAGTYQWLIADFTSISGFSSDAFTVTTTNFFNADPGAFAVALGGAGIGGDDSQIYLTYAAPIPEPRAALLAALGALALLRRRRNPCL